MSRRATAYLAAIPCMLSAVLAAQSAAAADSEAAASPARTLFMEARELAKDGHYDQACPKFEESLKLDLGIGTEFNLADCWEHLGRTASAQALFSKVAEQAHAAGQTEREQVARERAAALDAKHSHLVIDVPISAPGLEIRRDGVVVEPEKWGAPVAVDAEAHEVSARAPGRKPWSTKVDVPGKAENVTVTVPKLEDEAEAKKAAAPPKEPEPKAKSAELAHWSPGKHDPQKPDDTLQMLLYGGIGVGAVLAGTSLVFYKMKNDQAKEICPSGNHCTRSEIDEHDHLVDQARTARGFAYLGFGIGGAAVLTSIVLAVVRSGGSEGAGPSAFGAGPVVGQGTLGASMEGRF